MNILFIFSDQHRAHYMSHRGIQPQVQTPNLDALASRGVSFNRAYTPSPLCVPARAALLAGQYASALYGDSEGLARDWRRTHVLPGRRTLAHHLADNGYACVHLGKAHLRGEREGHNFGFNQRHMGYITDNDDYRAATSAHIAQEYKENGTGGYGGGKETYNSKYRSSSIDHHAHFDTLVVDHAIDVLSRSNGRPFYMQVGIEKPHPTLFPPRRFMEAVDPAEVKLPDNWNRAFDESVPYRKRQRQHEEMNLEYLRPHKNPATGEWARCGEADSRGWSERDVQNALAAYIASVNYIDYEIGRLIAGLEQHHLLDDTLIVYSSDHGDLCLDHGMIQKHCGFEGAINVPLIFAGPGVQQQGSLDQGLAELIDLFPTFCDYAGIDTPGDLHGQSLMPALRGDRLPDREIACSEYFWDVRDEQIEGWERVAVSYRWKYIDNGRFEPELYDLENDPHENHNLAQNPAHAAVLEEMRARLAERLGTHPASHQNG